MIKAHIAGGHETLMHMTLRMKESNQNRQYNIKHKGEHDIIKHMTHRMGGRNPNEQDIINHWTCRIKEHIMERHGNIRHMTYRRKKVIRVDKIIQIARHKG